MKKRNRMIGRVRTDVPEAERPKLVALIVGVVGIVVFAPLARSGKGWATGVATVLGVLMAAWSACGVLFMTDRETELAPGVPGSTGPGVAALLGALIAFFGGKAHRE